MLSHPLHYRSVEKLYIINQFLFMRQWFWCEIFSRDNEDYILNAIIKYYTVSNDCDCNNCLSLTIEWNYRNGHVGIYMPDYIPKSLKRLQHPNSKKPQYSPHRWTAPTYGQCLQMLPDLYSIPLLQKKGKFFIQPGVRTFYYYYFLLNITIPIYFYGVHCKKSTNINRLLI